jgi:DNA-binding NtrC family response regulator
MAKILIVDDEAAQRRIMADILKAAGHRVAVAESADQAEESAGDFQPDVVLTDLKMPGKGGLALVETLSRLEVPPEVVVITAYGTVDTAVKAMRLGAYDYLTKPLEKEELLLVAERAAEKYALRVESKRLRQELHGRLGDGLVAESGAMKHILEMVSMVAQSDATVLVRGDSCAERAGPARSASRVWSTCRAPAGRGPCSESTARPFRKPCWRRNCSDTKKAPSQEPRPARSASSNPPMAAPFSWTRWGTCP